MENKMQINTRIFGEITVDQNRVITFVNGLVGFPDLKDFLLIHDLEKGLGAGIQWLQSVQEPAFAIPVIDPLSVMESYNPQVEDELLATVGDFTEDELLVLVTISVPSDITGMTVNLKGPIVVNTVTRKACQLIAEGEGYEVKFPVYEILKARKVGE